MKEVRAVKGMKVLYEISCSDIIASYKAYLEEWNAAHPETTASEGEGETPSEPVENPTSQNDFVKNAVAEQLGLFAKYGYDGINVSYTTKNPLSVPENGQEEFLAEQEAFLE